MKQRLSKAKISKRINVEFWDHTQGEHKLALSQVAGWLLSYNGTELNGSMVVRLWNYPEDPEFYDETSDVTISRPTVKNRWYPNDGPWTKKEPKQ